MALYCAISNEVPEHPVVSPTSGAVFEKRIIEKYIIENGIDPISGKELRNEDLIEIKTPPIVKPKPPHATSIPATLKSLQDEWDAVMLHSFTQRQQLQTARQELSHALYQHDAACRVIARLNKEVTAAREALATLKPQAGITARDALPQPVTPPIVKPKPPHATSIPATLKSLQDEWDAVMLHSFTQRQQLQTARQELSHALYQHDAACRVIARLNKEVTAAREALATLKPQAGITARDALPQPAVAAEAGGTANQPTEQAGMSPEVIQKLQDKATVLTQERKKRGRTVPEELTSQENIRNFKTLSSHPGLHSASVPGILALDIHAADTSKILTGGNDRNATVFNKDTEQVVAILKGHTKKVTAVIYHPDEDIVITSSPDATIRVWSVAASQTSLLLRAHDAAVTGLSLHPTGDYVLSCSEDQNWAFSDIRSGRLLTKVKDGANVPLTTAMFHPDGLIFGTGTEDSQVKIWDLKEQRNVANFTGHTGAITAISFSENGYYLATAADDSCVKLWDLRKLKNFKTLQLTEEANYQIRDLCFDQSGTYLAVAGSDVRVYLCKQWQELKVFNDHTATSTGVRFGKHAQYIASTSMDRTLKLYGL